VNAFVHKYVLLFKIFPLISDYPTLGHSVTILSDSIGWIVAASFV